MKARGHKGVAERYRPYMFSEVIGLEKILASLKQIWAKPQRPVAYMFSGGSGAGKTTIARIMAISSNCTHAAFGEPCVECRKVALASAWDITEINASDMTGIDAIRDAVSGAGFSPRPPSNYRTYILDEAQRLSEASQSLLLKYFEGGPPTTLWFICTTQEQKILQTLRRRCIHFKLPTYRPQEISKLVNEIVKLEGTVIDKVKVEQFLALLYERQLDSPGLVLPVLERFLVSKDPNVVDQASGETDTFIQIARGTFQGDWDTIRSRYFDQVSSSDAIGLRNVVAGYFRSVLVKTGRGPRAQQLCDALDLLSKVPVYEEGFASSHLLAVLYRISQKMKQGAI